MAIKELALPVASKLTIAFLKAMRVNSGFFRTWKLDRALAILSKRLDKLETKMAYQEATAALRDLGWRKSTVDKARRSTLFMRPKGGWPVVVTINSYAQDDFSTISLRLKGDRLEKKFPGEDVILDVLRANKLRFKIETSDNVIGPVDGIHLLVDKNTAQVTAKHVARLVAEVLESDFNTVRPQYMVDPWSPSGRVKLLPNAANHYIVFVGDVDYRVSSDQHHIFIDGEYAFKAHRTQK